MSDSEHIETLLHADIQAQLAAMAEDPDIQREIAAIQREFSITEADGLSEARASGAATSTL